MNIYININICRGRGKINKQKDTCYQGYFSSAHTHTHINTPKRN